METTEKPQSEIEIQKYLKDVNFQHLPLSLRESITKIVSQLESCNYETEAGFLKNNVAFLALKRMAL